MGDLIDFSKLSTSGSGATPKASSELGGHAGASGDTSPRAGEVVERTYPAAEGEVEVELRCAGDGHAHLLVKADKDLVAPVVRDSDVALARSFGVDYRDQAMMSQLRQSMGEDALASFVMMFVQRRLFAQALSRTGVEPFLTPAYLTKEAPVEGEPYAFEVDCLLRPEVSLSSYDPVEFEFPEEQKISSKDVSDFLDGLSEQLATYEPDLSKAAAGETDHVTIRMSAQQNGKPVPALTMDRQEYQIGSGFLPEEMERALVGMKVGETRSVSVSLPSMDADVSADAPTSFAMSQVTITLLQVNKRVPARIDDVWVSKNAPQAGTLLGFRSQVRSSLEREAQAARHDQMVELSSAKLSERLQWDAPQDYIDRARDEMVEQFAMELQGQGIDFRAYVSQPGFDQQGFVDKMSQQASESLRRALALDDLANHLGIEVTDEEATRSLGSIEPGREQEALRAMRETGQMSQIRQFTRRMKANEWLVKNAKDSSGPHLQLV